MTKTDYTAARRVLRDNGYFALKWMSLSTAQVMVTLRDAKVDPLAERVDALRLGFTPAQFIRWD